MKQKFLYVLSFLTLLVIASCEKFEAKVVTFEDGFQPIGKTYIIVPTSDQKQSLEWKEMASKMEKLFNEKGMVFSKNADYKVMFDYNGIRTNPSITGSIGSFESKYFSISELSFSPTENYQKILFVDIFETKTNQKVYEMKIVSNPSNIDIYESKECLLEAFDMNFPLKNETSKKATVNITLPCEKSAAKRKAELKKKK